MRGWAAAGRPAGVSVVAESQTAGRGRLSRVWQAGPGEALQLSVLLRPRLPVRRLPLVSLALGVAVHDAVAHPDVSIKWPNDLLDGRGRKLAGVLAEAETVAGQVAFVVAGVGLNVSAAPADLPAAGCLAAIGAGTDRELLAVRLLVSVAARMTQAEQAPSALLSAWRAACGMWGKQAQIGGVRGIVTGLTEDGGLEIRDDDGACRVVVAGDVHMVSEECR